MTTQVIDAVLQILRDHDEWPVDGPEAFHFGEMPPLSHRCEVSVMAGPQLPLEKPMISETREDLVIQLTLAIDTANHEASLRRALSLRDELRRIVWSQDDWGLDEVVATELGDSTVGVGVDTRSNGWVLAVDVRFSVTYRDEF